jgi:hypothetical protein
MPELFQISRSHSGMGKKGGSMDLVRLSGGLLVNTKLMKNHGQGNKLQKRISIAGKRSTGKGKITGKGICINGLIYTRPTKDRPWTGIRFTSP